MGLAIPASFGDFDFGHLQTSLLSPVPVKVYSNSNSLLCQQLESKPASGHQSQLLTAHPEQEMSECPPPHKYTPLPLPARECPQAVSWPLSACNGVKGNSRPKPLQVPTSLPSRAPELLLGRPSLCKEHISFLEERKGRERKPNLLGSRTTCQHKEQTRPKTKCGLSSYQREGMALSAAQTSVDHRPWNECQICSLLAPACSAAGPAQGRHRQKITFQVPFWNLLEPGELRGC